MRATVAYINQNRLKDNLNLVKSIVKEKKILAVVKANAYGHSAEICSKIFIENGVEMLGVAFASEGARLRADGVNAPILVIVPPSKEECKNICIHQLQTVVSDIETVKQLSREAISVGVLVKLHLFIDIGMHRDGVMPHKTVEFMNECQELKNIKFVGVCSHLSTSESEDTTIAQEQINIFKKEVESLQNAGYTFEYIHLGNSGAIGNFYDPFFNMVRPGLSLYGYSPAKHLKCFSGLKPVLTLKSKVLITRNVPKGDYISYGMKYQTKEDTKIATIPIGYGDGFFRIQNGDAEVLIGGNRFNIAGVICMDECMVDVGKENIRQEDEVVVIGEQFNESIWADDIAEKVGTIPYEILASISERVPRVVV